MNLSDFYNAVSRQADLDSVAINVAETKRVMAVAFKVLSTMEPVEVLDTISRGLVVAKKKAEQSPPVVAAAMKAERTKSTKASAAPKAGSAKTTTGSRSKKS